MCGAEEMERAWKIQTRSSKTLACVSGSGLGAVCGLERDEDILCLGLRGLGVEDIGFVT